MNPEIKDIITIIINEIETYRKELQNREDVKELSIKYQQGLQDGMKLIIAKLKAVIHE